jgi:hypothetical protein
MATLKHKTNPYIPKPERKEIPVVEELVNPRPAQAPHMMKQDVPILVPNYNRLYDTYRTTQGWRYSADGYANGTVTTVAGSAVLVPVKLTLPTNTQSPNWRLEQWPGGTLLYLVVRAFFMGPQTATFATAGEIDVVFIDQFGNTAPLGVVPNNGFYTFSSDTIMPGPVTDTGQQSSLGNLSFTLNTGATVGTYSWQMAFGVAYLLPALKGYDVKRIGEDHHVEHHH